MPEIGPQTADGEVARAVSQGAGQTAEAELMRRFSRRVVLYGLRHLRDEARAHDLAQDVMLSVLQKLRTGAVQEPDRIGSFILGTARWMALDTRRRERRLDEIAAEAASQGDTASTMRDLAMDADKLHEALTQLPERERSVVVLTFLHDRTAAEIAETFGLKSGHVRVIRHRAIARLGELMGVGELEEGGRS